jgi:hypothetical protein
MMKKKTRFVHTTLSDVHPREFFELYGNATIKKIEFCVEANPSKVKISSSSDLLTLFIDKEDSGKIELVDVNLPVNDSLLLERISASGSSTIQLEIEEGGL